MKKKLAKILRRWANKLSPDTKPLRLDLPPLSLPVMQEVRKVKKFQAAHIYAPSTLREIERDPKLAAIVELDTRKDLLDSLALSLYEEGAISFRTEDGLEYAPKRIIATCYAVINNNKNNPNYDGE